MFHFIDFDIEKNVFTLIFFLIFISGITLFHTVILSSLLERKGKSIQPAWLLFAIYNAVGVVLFFISPSLTICWFIFLFVSVFVLVILAAILGIIGGIFLTIKKTITQKKGQPLYKTTGTILLGLISIILFFATGPFFFFISIIGTILYSAFTGGNRQYFKLQAILPTSKIRSMAMGLIEVEGVVSAIESLNTPIKSKKCIGYYYTVEEEKRDKDGDSSYSTIHSEKKCNRFLIKDDSGEVEVLPEKLDLIMLPIDEQYQSGRKRYTQKVLFDGNEMLLIGKATLEEDKPVIAHEENRNVFGIAPADRVTRWNRFKPLRTTALIYVMTFAFLVGMILILSIEEVDGRVVVTLPENLFSWSFK